MMQKTILVAAVFSLCLCASASADLSVTPWYDPATGTTWGGSTLFSQEDPNSPGNFLKATVEWAVEWDSAESTFRYHYQIETEADSDYNVTVFTTPMLPSNKAVDIDAYLIDTGDEAPTNGGGSGVLEGTYPNATKAVWSFDGIAANETSYGLTYESVNMPQLVAGTIVDGGLFIASADIPSPSTQIPEPATMSLLALGGLAILRRKR